MSEKLPRSVVFNFLKEIGVDPTEAHSITITPTRVIVERQYIIVGDDTHE